MRIDGKEIANEILENLKVRVKKLNEKDIVPYIAIVLIGDDPASKAYVRQKELKSTEIGAKSTAVFLDSDVSNEKLLSLIDRFNQEPQIHGIIVQRPVPLQIDEEAISLAVIPEKDIDGFHPDSLFSTPIWEAVLKILERVMNDCSPANELNADRQPALRQWLSSKKIIVIGKGQTGGGPIKEGFQKLGIEPHVVDSKTKNSKEILKKADIIISAVGKSNIIKPEMVKDKAILISVGMYKGEDGKLHGDYNVEEIKDIVSFYTPVPGGVGPVNAACLLENLVLSAENLLR
ncbi:MAG: tetrahydrofolate dehydrogenase/cyclohydrolase catalytic domain-containing protein [Candidatus Levybacteria bacterium]|nr:tetrahydrofolate dehydrogenase/cyclohydrolase catalytic domain-containing protein [Candidatus Levybacteria bacterium]